MQFNVAQLLKEPIGATREYELVEAFAAVPDVPAIERYEGRARLMHINEGVLAEVAVGTKVRLTCSRCLSDTEQDVSVRFAEEYRTTVDMATGATIAVDDQLDKFTLDQHHTLDLTEAVRQYILTAMPLSPLCREDCAGICPICGRDRNVSPCDCRSEPADPRLEALGRLLEDDERR